MEKIQSVIQHFFLLEEIEAPIQHFPLRRSGWMDNIKA